MESLCFDRDSQKCSRTGIWDTMCWFQPCPILYVIPRDILTPQTRYKAKTPKELGQMFQSIAVVDRLPGQQWLRLSAVAAASTNPWITTRELATTTRDLRQSLNHNKGTCNCRWLSDGGLSKKLHKQETIKLTGWFFLLVRPKHD